LRAAGTIRKAQRRTARGTRFPHRKRAFWRRSAGEGAGATTTVGVVSGSCVGIETGTVVRVGAANGEGREVATGAGSGVDVGVGGAVALGCGRSWTTTTVGVADGSGAAVSVVATVGSRIAVGGTGVPSSARTPGATVQAAVVAKTSARRLAVHESLRSRPIIGSSCASSSEGKVPRCFLPINRS